MNQRDLKNSRRKKAAFSHGNPKDRLPPHSPEAERGVLGCILLDDAKLTEVIEKLSDSEAFYELRNRTIWEALTAIAPGFDASTEPLIFVLQEHLKKHRQLDEVGGLIYLTSLDNDVPSAANLPYYLDIVIEKFRLRKLVMFCTELPNRIYEHTGEIDVLMDEMQRDLSILFERHEKSVGESASWNELLDFDTDHDQNCLIGMHNGKTSRWLCRGHGAWLIGPSGVGKSSLALLFAAAMAAGIALWGITPVKPLRVLVVQAENDKGDMAEMVRGVKQGLKLDDFDQTDVAQRIAENFTVRSVKGKIGLSFCQWLKKEIVAHKADLVLVDPLLSFAGIDVSRQDQTSQFLRLWLDPVIFETGCCLVSVHHTGKPPKVERGHSPTLYDLAYAGIGSSELVNWARAIVLLQPAGEGHFRFVLAKRGKRAWATHPDGQPTQTLWLKHASEGIFWEQVEPPQESEAEAKSERKGRPSKQDGIIATMNLAEFCMGCKADGETQNGIAKRLEGWLAKNKEDASFSTCKRALKLLVKNGKIAKSPDDGRYRKGENA